MTLPTDGKISLGDVNVELGNPRESFLALGGQFARDLAGVPSGPIRMSDLRGKSHVLPPGHYMVTAGNHNQFYGYGATNIGVVGSVSPNYMESDTVDGVYINSPNSGTWRLAFTTTGPSAATEFARIESMTFGGVTVPILNYVLGPQNTIIANLTSAQFNTIRDVVADKTTPFIMNYKPDIPVNTFSVYSQITLGSFGFFWDLEIGGLDTEFWNGGQIRSAGCSASGVEPQRYYINFSVRSPAPGSMEEIVSLTFGGVTAAVTERHVSAGDSLVFAQITHSQYMAIYATALNQWSAFTINT